MFTVTCSDCGRLLAEAEAPMPQAGLPCPACGSSRRTIAVILEAPQVTVAAELELKVIDYPRLLLTEADTLIARGQFGIAIVVVHMACEVAVQRALSAAFEKRNIADLETAIAAYFSGYNLGNDRLRALYTGLTGDRIQDQPFWKSFKESAERRNQIIHRGRMATDAEAKASHTATTAFVDHVAPQG